MKEIRSPQSQTATLDNLTVSSAPHMVSSLSTDKIMITVLAALAPAFAVGIFQFGYRAVTLTAVCTGSCVLFEYFFNKIVDKTQTVKDMSAALTGVILAMNLPSSLPYWMAVVGSFAAIIVVKQLFGGIGQNLVNPAVTARVFLFIAFATDMTTWPSAKGMHTDALTSATPLGVLSHSDMSLDAVVKEGYSNIDLFLGNTGGCIGEVSALAILAGGIFLIFRKIITPHIPFSFLTTVFVCGFFWSGLEGAVFQLCAGGVMLGAFFCATDYVTSPTLPSGKVLFGIGCGLLTMLIRMLIRMFASYPEGVSFAILLMNILTPYIDRLCARRAYHTTGKGNGRDE